MKSRALIAGALSLSLLTMLGTTTLTAAEAKPVEDVRLIMDMINPIATARFLSFTGTVQKVTVADNGLTYILLEDAAGAPANFVVSNDTYVVGNPEAKVGDVVTGFYDATLPMITPPIIKHTIVSLFCIL